MDKKKHDWLISFSLITLFVSAIFFAINPLAGMIIFVANWFNVRNWYELSR